MAFPDRCSPSIATAISAARLRAPLPADSTPAHQHKRSDTQTPNTPEAGGTRTGRRTDEGRAGARERGKYQRHGSGAVACSARASRAGESGTAPSRSW